MKKIFFSLSVAAFLMIASIATVFAQSDVIDVATGSPDHSKLVEAIKTADLVNTFKLTGPYTFFAPTNAAFEKISEAELKKLMKNKAILATTLKYHVVGGNWNSTTLMAAIKQNNGSVQLPTVSGGKLTASVEDGKIKLTDENGNSAFVINADIAASNGLIHVVDGVVHPLVPAITKKD